MIRFMQALLDRARREQAEWESLRSKVREALPGLVAVLVREYGVRRVTLFGSILRSAPSQRPDIDLLVEGLDASRRQRRWAASSCSLPCQWIWCQGSLGVEKSYSELLRTGRFSMPPEHRTVIELRRLLRDNEADAGILDALRAEISLWSIAQNRSDLNLPPTWQ